MSQAERLNKMQRGRQAVLTESIAEPYIQEQIWVHVTLMVGQVRGGKINHDDIIARLGGISALMQLGDALEGEQRQGDVAAQMEMDNGT